LRVTVSLNNNFSISHNCQCILAKNARESFTESLTKYGITERLRKKVWVYDQL
jgi:hypothetical protein